MSIVQTTFNLKLGRVPVGITHDDNSCSEVIVCIHVARLYLCLVLGLGPGVGRGVLTWLMSSMLARGALTLLSQLAIMPAVDDDESVRFPSCTAAIRCRSGACLLAQLTLPACLLSQSCPARLTMLGPAPTGCTVHCTLYCTVHCSLQTPHTHRNHTMILWVMYSISIPGPCSLTASV